MPRAFQEIGRRTAALPVLHRAPRPRRPRLPAGERVPPLSTDPAPGPAPASLLEGDLDVVGRLADASNATLFATLGPDEVPVVYKPAAGERPLWDFTRGSLHRREVATYLLDEALAFGLVPETVLREGPFGPGSVQRWVGPLPGEPVEPGAGVIDVVTAGDLDEGGPRQGWKVVVEAYDERGREVVLCHADDDRLAAMAVLDTLANNADRKGGHVLDAGEGRLAGVDHGLTFHTEHKLRTVLWGWSGEPVPDHLLAAVERVRADLVADLGARLGELLDDDEPAALRRRCRVLLRTGLYPRRRGDGPTIPWPAF